MSYKIEAVASTKEAKDRLKKEGREAKEWFAEGCFFTEGISIGGRTISPSESMATYLWGDRDPREMEKFFPEGCGLIQYGVGEMIPGLHCPDCGAQAFKTDQDGVATCGLYAGWYFYYTDIKADADTSNKNKIVMKYIDGVLQPVIEADNGSLDVGEVRK